MKPIETTECEPHRPGQYFKHGFVHVVYFWLKPDLLPADQERFETGLRQLVDRSEYAVTGHIGRPAGTPREVVDNTYDYCLIVSFDDAAGHQAYQDEPSHDVFREIASACAQRVQIYDSLGMG